MLWVAMVVVAAAAAAVVWGNALVARHRAARTADLVALAAAAQVQAGNPQPCQEAGRLAAPAGAEVESCEVLPDRSVLVVVRLHRSAPGPFGIVLSAARGRARAGVQP